MQERPDGSTVTTIGWMLVVVGLLAAFVASNVETLKELIFGVAIANLGIGLGVLLLSLGYLVRALWFLPGREHEISRVEDQQTAPKNEPNGFHFCDWCHRGLYAPDVACSRQSETEIHAGVEQGKVLQRACEYELNKRGYLEK